MHSSDRHRQRQAGVAKFASEYIFFWMRLNGQFNIDMMRWYNRYPAIRYIVKWIDETIPLCKVCATSRTYLFLFFFSSSAMCHMRMWLQGKRCRYTSWAGAAKVVTKEISYLCMCGRGLCCVHQLHERLLLILVSLATFFFFLFLPFISLCLHNSCHSGRCESRVHFFYNINFHLNNGFLCKHL